MNTTGLDALTKKLWQAELDKDVMDNEYFNKMGMIGTGENNIIQIKDELTKSAGDTITFGLGMKLGKTTGVTGDNELEGNESAITYYSEAVIIAQWRDAVRLKGKFREQQQVFNMRKDAKDKLSIRKQEFLEQQYFFKLGGVTNESITDINGQVLGLFEDGTSALTFSNTPATVPAADSAAGIGDRYLCANSAGADAMTSSDKLTPALISKLKVMAMVATPKIKPLRINGQYYYVMFVHPFQAYDLKRDEEFRQAQREAQSRGKDNPIFSGAIGIWDNVIIHQNEYVPFLDVSAAGHNFAAAASGTDFLVDTYRAIFCGQQAAALAKCKDDTGWVEKYFDYDNKTGFKTGLICGIQKIQYNSKDYGCMVLDTAASQVIA
jgi:N4-gp56 family major capsid protein